MADRQRLLIHRLVVHESNRPRQLRYGLHLPANYEKTEKSWPLLCYLHGIRECGRLADTDEMTRKLLTAHGPLRDREEGLNLAALDRFIINNFIIVVPQVPCAQEHDQRSFADNIWGEYAPTFKEVVLRVAEEYKGDRHRIYLTGFSRGGNGVFDFAQAQDFWAALWPVDPTRIPKSDPGRPTWLWYGIEQRPPNDRTRKILSLQEAPRKGRPSGDRLYTDTRVGHGPTAVSAYNDGRVYAWLRARRRGE